jgi:peptide/nickel transport system ATP-binding protein
VSAERPPALEVTGLRVRHPGQRDGSEAVRGVDLRVTADEVVAVVGASGSGKSSLCSALIGLTPPTAEVAATRLAIGGRDLTGATDRTWRSVRGRTVVLVPQHGARSLAPTVPVGRQLRWHLGGDALVRHRGALEDLGLHEVLDRPDDLPHQFSGGQLHRLVLALATVGRTPALIIADEPTGSLDAAIAAKVIGSLDERRRAIGAGLVLVTHDLELATAVGHRLAVVDQGRIVEVGSTAEVIARPAHPRTRALLDARPGGPALGRRTAGRQHRDPRPDQGPGSEPPILVGRNLYRYFGAAGTGRPVVRAVDDVDVELIGGATTALVGASGSGKSTLARILAGADRPTAGDLVLAGRSIDRDAVAELQRAVALVGQDPRSALNRRRSVGHALIQVQRLHGVGRTRRDRRDRALAVLEAVGLRAAHLGQRPRTLSGGEVARVVLARALLTEPRVLVLDEPTAALDREVQVEVLALVHRLQADHGFAVLLITHDLALAAGAADALLVIDGGRIVERGAASTVLDDPRHDVTASLVGATFATGGGRSDPTDGGATPRADRCDSDR